MKIKESSQRYIYKINSTRFKRSNWNLKLTISEAKENDEYIALANTQVLRFIEEITNNKVNEDKIKEVKMEISKLKQQDNTKENKNKIKKLIEKKDNLTFVKEYIVITFNSIEDFNRSTMKKKCVCLNGVKYKRLVGTSGGVKKNSVIFVAESIHGELDRRLNNNRSTNKELVPAKFEAYKSLSCSSSIPVSDPKGVLVIKDGVTNFNDDVIVIHEDEYKNPIITYEKNYNIDLSFADGCGMISRELAITWANDLGVELLEKTPTGFNIRNSFTKGMVFTFPFHEFADKVAKNYIVEDAWGDKRDIRECDLIITTNMLKLWDSYDNLESYLASCKENKYTFSITKMCPLELENERNLNYQFLQSYELSDEDINELVKPTISLIRDITYNDYQKAILFTRGVHMNEQNVSKHDFDFAQALMIDSTMIKDPFVKSKLKLLLDKTINDAKKGVIRVSGNYSIISGDLYALCQHMFDMNVTGILKRGEVYSKAWNDKGEEEIVSFRAPMTCHNNIRKHKLNKSKEAQYWYRYISTALVLNAWDTTCQATNGADFDKLSPYIVICKENSEYAGRA